MDDDFFSSNVKVPSTASPFDEILVAAPQPPSVAPQQPSVPFEVISAPVVAAPVATVTRVDAAAPSPSAASTKSQLVAELQKSIADRTASADKATVEKDDKTKKAAQQFLQEQNRKREERLKLIKSDHLKEQSEYEKKASELKQAGAVWASIGFLVDLKKPNPHSKKTERMKTILLELEKRV